MSTSGSPTRARSTKTSPPSPPPRKWRCAAWSASTARQRPPQAPTSANGAKCDERRKASNLLARALQRPDPIVSLFHMIELPVHDRLDAHRQRLFECVAIRFHRDILAALRFGNDLL